MEITRDLQNKMLVELSPRWRPHPLTSAELNVPPIFEFIKAGSAPKIDSEVQGHRTCKPFACMVRVLLIQHLIRMKGRGSGSSSFLPPPSLPALKLPYSSVLIYSGRLYSGFLWATLWPEQNRSIKDLPAQRRKLINIITAHHWHSGSEVIQTHQKMPNLSMSTENLPLPLTLAGWWRQLRIAGASVASKGASANVWWDSGD